MHLLLPPSEAKSPGGRGRSLRARPDAGPLAQARTPVLAALAQLVARATDGGADTAGAAGKAAAALLLPPGVAAAAIRTNAAVLDAPTTPALRRYAGTVYAGLDFASLSSGHRRTAERSVLIFSGLFGVVRGGEPVPDYRVPAAATLPGIGTAASYWRPVLREVMPALLARGLVVDLRSADYAAMWRPPAQLSRRLVRVRVLSRLPSGGHGIVSYPSKLAKGRLARALVERAADGLPVRDADDVRAAWRACGGVDERLTDTGLDLYTD